jgi:hypothetical protein
MTRITDDTGLAENKGRRGGIFVEVEAPSRREIAERSAAVRASWFDPMLRLELRLPEIKIKAEAE